MGGDLSVSVQKGNLLRKELFISRQDIHKQVVRLAEEISACYEDQELILIGILKGAVFFMADLVRHISIPVKLDFIRAASYGSELKSSGTVKISKDLGLKIQGKPVIIVEDIVDSGLTLSKITETIAFENPASIRVCALIDK